MPRGTNSGQKPDDPFTDEDWGRQPGEDDAGELPMPSAGDYEQFLKPFHLKAKQGTLELLRVTGATEYSDVVIHVQVDGKPFRIGLRNFDPGYASLAAKFGRKKEDWKGTIRYKVLPFKGKLEGYVAVRA